jgi:hypothetical protein
MDWPEGIQGENAEGPELPHATSLPGGALPTGSTCIPWQSAFHAGVQGKVTV